MNAQLWKRRHTAIFIVPIFTLLVISAPAFGMCFEEAGQIYNISPVLLWSIAKAESGFNPVALNRNKNGTYDYGVMQICSSWYPVLGYERWMLLSDPCFNVHVGAWILSQCIERHGYTWEAVGCYNATSKKKRSAYASRIMRILRETGHAEAEPERN